MYVRQQSGEQKLEVLKTAAQVFVKCHSELCLGQKPWGSPLRASAMTFIRGSLDAVLGSINMDFHEKVILISKCKLPRDLELNMPVHDNTWVIESRVIENFFSLDEPWKR